MGIENKIFDWKLILGCITGIILLYISLYYEKENLRFEDLALGNENVVMLGEVNGKAIHCHDLNDLNRCLSSYENDGRQQPVLLWLGNSQLHAINQYKLGEETAASEIHRRFQTKGDYFLTLSQPNANLQEHYLLFSYIFNQLPLEMLVLPVVFDDMRDDGIRTSLSKALNDQNTTSSLRYSSIGQSLIANYGEQDAAGNDMAALDGTVQKKTEKKLNELLNEIWPIWAERPTLRGNFFNWLYQFRNWSLRIDPSSTRKMIHGRYKKNKDALTALLDFAKIQKIKVLVYIAPLRNDVKIPYNPEEYEMFKSEIKKIALKSNANFLNLENLVPGQLWGTKESTTIGIEQELDFMHFQAGGHGLLAEELYEAITMIRSIP